MDKPMDRHFSVFNGHVNDADKKARRMMEQLNPDYLKRVEELDEQGDGIMNIFNHPPEPATEMYTLLVTAYVNERWAKGDTEPDRVPTPADKVADAIINLQQALCEVSGETEPPVRSLGLHPLVVMSLKRDMPVQLWDLRGPDQPTTLMGIEVKERL